MQNEGELRSEIDYLIDILRSNPHTKFTHSKLQSLTGYSKDFIKKWINVLEEQGHIRFFYNISNEEFAWVSNESKKQIYNDREITNIVHGKNLPRTRGHKSYSKEDMRRLLEDINLRMEEAKLLNKRIKKLRKSANVDLAAVEIARHELDDKKKELEHLLEQLKKNRD